MELPLTKSTLNVPKKPTFQSSGLRDLFSRDKFQYNITIETDNNSLCIDCKGSKLACGRLHCPILLKYESFRSNQEHMAKYLFGASPPAVFIGRMNYPNIFLGPMIPPDVGNTSLYDSTESWFGLSQNKIISMRLRLVRGKFQTNVYKEDKNKKLLDLTREIGLARTSIESEVSFKKTPVQRLKLDDNVQPMGPAAQLKKISLGSSKTHHRIEKFHYDTDLHSKDAIIQLRKENVSQTDITRAFSLGLFGEQKNRKLVPTRWSITAVDSLLGLDYWKKVLQFPLINEIRVFESTYLANRFLVLMLPDYWGYELIEAWFPNSPWNPGRTIGIVNDYEGITGRKTYARIGGCYYSGRNMVGEYLTKEHRQARVVILRETYPGLVAPMGVWLVREMVRKALEFPYKKYETLDEAFNYIETRLLIKRKHWIETSGILSLKGNTKQKSLHFYFS